MTVLVSCLKNLRFKSRKEIQWSFLIAAHTHFQVYNYESKNLLNEIDLPVHSEICFWKWVNEETIILVSDTQILQWMVFRGLLSSMFTAVLSQCFVSLVFPLGTYLIMPSITRLSELYDSCQ